MVALTKFTAVAAATLLSLAYAHPLQTSPNPASILKRALFVVSDLESAHQAQLTSGLTEAVKVVHKVLESMSKPAHAAKFGTWFGTSGPVDGIEKVRKVFENFAGKPTEVTGAAVLANVHVFKDDYWMPPAGKGVDGKTLFCSITTPDGKTGAAYFSAKKMTSDATKITPGMHFCPKVFLRKNLAALIADKCKHLGTTLDAELITKNFVGANILHEFM